MWMSYSWAYGVNAFDTMEETTFVLIRGLLSLSTHFSTEVAVYVVHLWLYMLPFHVLRQEWI